MKKTNKVILNYLTLKFINFSEFLIVSEEELDQMLHSKGTNELADLEQENTPSESSKLTEVFAEFTPEKQLPG